MTWLRQLTDVISEGEKPTVYKQKLQPLSKILDSAIAYDQIIEMNHDGKQENSHEQQS